jgi:tetratricopeptide (TPR) repeat protein
LNNLGSLYAAMGDSAKAIPLFERALRIREAKLGANHPDTAASLNDLAMTYQAQGDDEKAESFYQQAIKIRAAILGEAHPDYAASLHNLASLYYSRGEYAKAEPLYLHALEIQRKALGANHPDFAKGLTDLGALYMAMGDNAKAEPLLRQGLEVSRRNLEKASDVQSERQQLLMSAQLRDQFDVYLSLALRAKLPAGRVYRFALAWKGAVFAREWRLHRFRRHWLEIASPEATRIYNELQAVAKSLAVAAFAKTQLEPTAEPHSRQLEELWFIRLKRTYFRGERTS